MSIDHDTGNGPNYGRPPQGYSYPPLQRGRGVALLEEVEAPAQMVARVNRVMGDAAKRFNGLVKLTYLMLPLPRPRLIHAHVVGTNAAPELAQEVKRLIEDPVVNAVQVAACRGLLPQMGLIKITHYPEDMEGKEDYLELPHEDGPIAAPGNTMLWYLLGAAADAKVNGKWIPLSQTHPNIIGPKQLHRAPSPVGLRALGRPSARTLIAVFGQNGPIGGLYAWAGMFGVPDLASTVMTNLPCLAKEVDKFYGGATKGLETHPILLAGVEGFLTVANAVWNLHPGVRLTRHFLSRRSS